MLKRYCNATLNVFCNKKNYKHYKNNTFPMEEFSCLINISSFYM